MIMALIFLIKLRQTSKLLPPKSQINLDELTDVSNFSQFMVFARYVKWNTIEEHFFCKPFKTATRVTDIFNLVKRFFNTNDILLQRLRSFCTNGAPVMPRNQF